MTRTNMAYPIMMNIDKDDMTERKDSIEIISTKSSYTGITEYYWYRTAMNGEIISSGEGYTRRVDAERAAKRANPDLYSAQI